jgi:hypothetical protein
MNQFTFVGKIAGNRNFSRNPKGGLIFSKIG